ncbi:Tab2/Atab2 family RNA-binding protein [Microcoleus sp. LEGE 07076]|uniref:Tab2/Atab2 family RNA-binding protein n=1 Tax=Microcoleus sp. LEGE 07076 TaxID=915322 RepID=UPI00187F9BDA|nr:Tab2/Atab2 family RNA-binding protein [Microcoleus sp. LEGE 07076]MBE9187229.1 Tab2/Atab2 family RNA-binding protein [Microcoleus sp. LEGE 07076]
MRIWQADFYRRPLQDEAGKPLWELLICDGAQSFQFSAFCRQGAANSNWLAAQLQQQAQTQNLPDLIQVFRPQSLSLIEAAGKVLGIKVEATRRTAALKLLLQKRAKEYLSMPNYTAETYSPIALETPPPVPLPENLWGDGWRFASLPAGDIEEAFQGRALPILEMPELLLPLTLGLASTVPVPGVVIDGGRQSMRLARWLEDAKPFALNYIAGAPDGLILEAGLADRWVVATFEDREVKAAAQIYQQRQQSSKGLHFLLVQPDDSGITYTGFWLLKFDR